MQDHPGLDQNIAAYYARGRERERLKAKDRLEEVRTRELLARFLPPPPATVLDVGGGTGVYALPLAEHGYRVYLIDPVGLHIEQALHAAGERGVELAGATVGDARQLQFQDQAADVVLLMGPLYHLTESDERLAALRETVRVLRSGGAILATAISRFAMTYEVLLGHVPLTEQDEEVIDRHVASGQHRNDGRRPGWFTTAYFHHPRELGDELAAAGLSVEALVAVEGPGQFVPN